MHNFQHPADHRLHGYVRKYHLQ